MSMKESGGTKDKIIRYNKQIIEAEAAPTTDDNNVWELVYILTKTTDREQLRIDDLGYMFAIVAPTDGESMGICFRMGTHENAVGAQHPQSGPWLASAFHYDFKRYVEIGTAASGFPESYKYIDMEDQPVISSLGEIEQIEVWVRTNVAQTVQISAMLKYDVEYHQRGYANDDAWQDYEIHETHGLMDNSIANDAD